MFTFYGLDGSSGTIKNSVVWSAFSIAFAVIIAFYVLRSIAIYVMANKQGIKKAWLAFIPCVWVYTASMLVKETGFFGKSFGKIALWFAIIYSVSEVLLLVYNFMLYLPIVGNFLAGHELFILVVSEENKATASSLVQIWEGMDIYGGADFVDPFARLGMSARFVRIFMNVVDIVSSICSIVSAVMIIFLYINLFKKYYPRHYIVMAVLSWMGIFAPLVFAVRNREPVNYRDYVRQRYNGWYYNGNPYENNYQQRPPQNDNGNKQPFDEFESKEDSQPKNPFDEFDN